MPELPEVETIRRGLAPRLVGRTLGGCRVRETRFRTPLDARALDAGLAGRRVTSVERRSKYLLLHLDDARVVVLHLGMSGRLDLVRRDAPLLPHTHVQLFVEPDVELRFSDSRRFGMLFVVAGTELECHPRFARLGPEPLDADFDLAYLLSRARRVRKPIKNFLMDAGVVVGVGNIYASEALHRARVHPMRAAGRIAPARLAAVHAAVRRVLHEALRAGGTTLQDFRDADGNLGEFQVRLRVYDREGRACRRCGARIRRIVQAGRSTFYCPACQR